MRTRRLTLGLLFGVLVLQAPLPNRAQDAADPIATAYRALRAGSHTEALEAAQAALAAEPDSPVALTLRAMIFADTSRGPAALVDLNRAIQLDPTYAFAHLIRGWVFVRDQSNNAAIHDFETVLRLLPDNPSALTGRALASLQKEEFAAAARDADKALAAPREFTPEDAARAVARLKDADLLTVIREAWARDEWEALRPVAYSVRGQARLALGQADAGLADLSEAIRLRPKDAAFRLERAKALGFRYQYPAALEDYRTASRLAPDNAIIHLLAATTAIVLQDHAAVLEHAAAAARLKGDDPDVLTQAADLYLKAGDATRALELFTRAARSRPTQADAITGQILANLALKQTAPVPELLARAESAGLPKEQVHHLRARMLLAQGNADGAMESLRAALAVNPKFVQARLERSEIRRARRDPLGADRDLERALEEQPRSVDLLIDRAWLQLESIDDRVAIELAKRAREIDPEHPKVLYFDALFALEGRDWSGGTARLNRLLQTGVYSESLLRMMRATASLEAGDIAAARADIGWIQSHDPYESYIASLQACCELALGDLDSAITTLEEAHRRSPEGWLGLELALCQWKAGRVEEASKTLQPVRAEMGHLALAWELHIRGLGTSEEARAALSSDERLALSETNQYVLHYERGVILGSPLRDPHANMFKPGRRDREADEPIEHALLLSAARASEAGNLKQARSFLEAAVTYTSATKIVRHLAARWLAELDAGR